MQGGTVIGKCRAIHNSNKLIYLLRSEYAGTWKVHIVDEKSGESVEKYCDVSKTLAYVHFSKWIQF